MRIGKLLVIGILRPEGRLRRLHNLVQVRLEGDGLRRVALEHCGALLRSLMRVRECQDSKGCRRCGRKRRLKTGMHLGPLMVLRSHRLHGVHRARHVHGSLEGLSTLQDVGALNALIILNALPSLEA